MSDPRSKKNRQVEAARRKQLIAEREEAEAAQEDIELLMWGVVNKGLPLATPKVVYSQMGGLGSANRSEVRRFDPFTGWTLVTVQEEDLDSGMAGNKLFDAICHCLSRYGFRGVSTTAATLAVEGYILLLPPVVAEWQEAFDDDMAEVPFTFRLPVRPNPQNRLMPQDETDKLRAAVLDGMKAQAAGRTVRLAKWEVSGLSPAGGLGPSGLGGVQVFGMNGDPGEWDLKAFVDNLPHDARVEFMMPKIDDLECG